MVAGQNVAWTNRRMTDGCRTSRRMTDGCRTSRRMTDGCRTSRRMTDGCRTSRRGQNVADKMLQLVLVNHNCGPSTFFLDSKNEE
jgi:hypothetical protein